MSESMPLSTEGLLAELEPLCAIPATTGNQVGLETAAAALATLMRRSGLEVQMLTSGSAPILLARTPGTGPALLLYHHYDLAPTGPWRSWNHNPHQLAERDGALFGRGVADGFGPLVAQLLALRGRLQQGPLREPVLLLVEGAALSGSPGLAQALEQAGLPPILGCLACAGEADATGRPICYAGARGRLGLRMSSAGARVPLPDSYATSVRNPLWRLIWGLAALRSEAEDVEVRGFYEPVQPLSRAESQLLRSVTLDEAGRLAAWGLDELLGGLSGSTLLRAEASVPSFTLSSVQVDPPGESDHIPTSASARLNLGLVPDQQPEQIVQQFREHLDLRGFTDLQLEQLPGSYAAARTPIDHAWVERVIASGLGRFGSRLPLVPLGGFALPLALFQQRGIPGVSLGLSGQPALVRGPNEQIQISDLLTHGELLLALLGKP